MRAVIVDIDGTIADPSHRLHLLDGAERDWNAFFAAQADDQPIEAIVSLVRLLHASASADGEIQAVLIVTARPERPDWRDTTLSWLDLHGVPHHRVYFRPEGDTRPDPLVKRDILQRILDDGYEPVLVIDDRAEVVRMWRDHGIVTLQCAPDEPATSFQAGQTLLHMLVGPSGAGKSTYADKNYAPHDVVCVDELRMQLYGDLGHSPEALKRVWRYAHRLIRARLESEVFTVLDATNLDPRDRAAVLAQVPRGVFTRYVVIDRPIDDKVAQLEWRPKELVIKHDKAFRKGLKEILAGDGHPYVTVQDKRTK